MSVDFAALPGLWHWRCAYCSAACGVYRATAAFFLAASLIATVVEYALSVFYEKAWGVFFWDYSAMSGNLRGRVCLPFALLWGGLSVAILPWLHPIVQRGAEALPDMLILPVGLLFVLDLILTGTLLRKSHDTDVLMWYR